MPWARSDCRLHFGSPCARRGARCASLIRSRWIGWGIRNHRKLLVCDERVAFVGGFNIASAYDGDGVTSGWCDLGLKVGGQLPGQLAATFEEMFARADFQAQTLHPLAEICGPADGADFRTSRSCSAGRDAVAARSSGLCTRDLTRATNVQIVAAYFLPTWGMRRDLTRIVRRGGAVQLILPGKSDVLVSQLAGQSLYRRFLKAGCGFTNTSRKCSTPSSSSPMTSSMWGRRISTRAASILTTRLMIRFEHQDMAAQARAIFAGSLAHCRQITREEWRKSRTVWRRLKQRWAYWLLVRIDPFLARRQWKALPD